MSSSTLDLTGEEDPVVGLGHGTGALGPSDSSDSGSDVTGGPGMDEGLSDEQSRRMPLSTTHGAGRDLGDADLASDSDRSGTGERGASGLESSPVDEQLSIHSGIASAAEDLEDLDLTVDPDEESADDELDDEEGSATVSDGAT